MLRAVRMALVLTLLSTVSVSAAHATTATTKPYIVVFNDFVADPAAVALQLGKSLRFRVGFVYKHALKGFSARLSSAALSAVASDPQVDFVSLDLAGTPACDPAVTQCLPTGIDRIDGDQSSTISGNGSGRVKVNVAVLDSGIDLEHQDLNVVGGTDCAGGHGYDDILGHGTSVAGVIGARDNGFGVVGVAPGARLWAVRVFNKGGSTNVSKIICGLDWVIGTRSDPDPSNDIAVANMSIRLKGSDDGNCGHSNKDALHMAICASVAAGVTLVAAAGNDGTRFQGFVPAAYDEVLTATAMTDLDGQPGGLSSDNCLPQDPFVDDTASFFSNFAVSAADQAHTIAAPGVCILSTAGDAKIDNTYAVHSGTSLSAPFVAGTVALCIASGPCSGLTPPQILQKIVADAAAYNVANPGYGFTGDPLHGPDPGKYYGYLIRAALY